VSDTVSLVNTTFAMRLITARARSTASGLVTSAPAGYLNNRTFTGQYHESAAALGSLHAARNGLSLRSRSIVVAGP
jgi:hypothetical protein